VPAPEADVVPAAPRQWIRSLDAVVVGFGVALAVGLRFVTRSPLWLDEALSVNIAELPIGQIPEALRHDGHPPLYYVLLHGWMEVFGTGPVAVRALSGVFGVALFPLLFVAGRRLGGRRGAVGAVALLALSPYAIRYSTETRMYALVMVLGLAAWLVADDALERPVPVRLAALALLTGALLWTHYWSMWLLIAAVAGLLLRLRSAHRRGRSDVRRRTIAVLAALALGGVLFLPWVPSLLYQSAHTGTPWALPVRPTAMVAQSLADLGGGPTGEAVLLGFLLLTLVLLALFGHEVDERHVDVDLHTRPEARPILFLVAVTLAIASAVGYATGSTFATRYIAVLVPLVLAVAALGLARLVGGVPYRLVVVAALVLGAIGGVRNAATDRTEAKVAADAIRTGGRPGDLVITCPDQLGPSLSRVLPATFDTVTYPRFESPERVDWVDYEARLAEASPARFGQEALRRAGSRTIWLVWSGSYRTHEKSCGQLFSTLLGARPSATESVADEGDKFFEHEAVHRFRANPPSSGGG